MAFANGSSNGSALVHYALPTFHAVDYCVCAAFLLVSSAVGIFFSFRNKKTTEDSFLGGRQMQAIPVGISTGVSFLSASSLVGLPAEMFINGYSYMFASATGAFGYFLGCALIARLLHPLGMVSLNEYLERRFKSRALTYSANIMVLACIFQYMGSCMFGSVVAFSSVTGGKISVVVALIIGGSVGIFYTALGGLRAVVWSDVIQSGVMILGIVMVIVKSVLDVPGGMPEISRVNLKYRRVHPISWSTDLTIRHTGWGLMFGIFLNWGFWSAQPACVQRLCCTRSLRDAYIVSGIAASLFFLFSILPCWAGINIFAYYVSRGCDVYAAGWTTNNEIILYYVRERLGFPGFQGLFVAALYAGSLSSLSSGLNAVSALLWNDIVKPLLKVQVSEARATQFAKIVVVVFGVLAMFWCYILYSFGGLIAQVNSTLSSSMYGSYFSLFLVAILFYHVHYKAAMAGLFVSFIVTFWLGLASLLNGPSTTTKLPTTTSRCAPRNLSVSAPVYRNVTLVAVRPKTALETLYSLSYVWFAAICLLLYIIVTMFVNGCLARQREDFDPRLLLPVARPGFWSRWKCRIFRSPSTSESHDDSEEMKALDGGANGEANGALENHKEHSNV